MINELQLVSSLRRSVVSEEHNVGQLTGRCEWDLLSCPRRNCRVNNRIYLSLAQKRVKPWNAHLFIGEVATAPCHSETVRHRRTNEESVLPKAVPLSFVLSHKGRGGYPPLYRIRSP